MKYLCLIYNDEANMAKMGKNDFEGMMAEYFQFTSDIKQSGHYIGGEALQPVQTATTVRVRNGRISTTDGPFAETKEQLGGYYLIDVPNIEHALKWAAKCPGALSGSIEVRPVMDYSMSS